MHVSPLNHIFFFFLLKGVTAISVPYTQFSSPSVAQKMQAVITVLGFALLSKLSMSCACHPPPCLFFFLILDEKSLLLGKKKAYY